MRKTMTKEVTSTLVKVAKMTMEDGLPKAVALPDETLLGNVSLEKAQKQLNKKYGEPVTVLEVHPDTKVYEMEVEKFMEHATIKEDKQEETKE